MTGSHARQQDDDAAAFQSSDRVAEHLRAGGVDGGDPRHPQDHHPHVGDLGQLEQEAVGGGEEQRAVEPVGDDVLGEQALLLGAVVAGLRAGPARSRAAAGDGRAGPGRTATTMPTATAVTRSNTTVTAKVSASTRASPRVDAGQRAQRADLDHPHRGGEQHAGQRRQRDAGRPAAPRPSTITASSDGVGQRGQPRARAGADVDGGTGDRGGGRDAAEQRRDEVGQALAEQLAVGVVALVHGHRRRRRWPTAGSPAPRAPRRRARRAAAWRPRRDRGSSATVRAAPAGSAPMRATSRPATSATTVASDDGEQRERQRRAASAGAEQHHRGDADGQRRRRPGAVCGRNRRRASAADGPDLVAVRAGDAERRRHLLQGDDDGDAGGEALDDRHRQ